MMEFRISLEDAERGWIGVELHLRPSGSGTTTLMLPVWTPGSYLVREYSQHVADVAADDGDGRPLAVHRTAKNRWSVSFGDAPSIRVRYRVYARDLTVRTSFVTHDWAFWNGACVLLWPVGSEDDRATVRVALPTGWRLVTGLGDARADAAGNAVFELAGLDQAVDTPCLAGADQEWRFDVAGRPHRLVAAGLGDFTPPDGFVDDLTKVVAAAHAVFGGEPPFAEYVFLALFGTRTRGGLEHEASSTLLMPRTCFVERRDYEDFLGLVAHEYLHVWNVKRMRPAEFWTFDYERENHTELLWLAEGFTAYFDDLVCRRAGVIPPVRYLELLGNNIRNLLDTPGREVQSLSESSHDAWIQLYRAGENTRNVSQNYYGNGAVAAFVLDAHVRETTGGSRSLDDVVRELYRSTYEDGRGYTYDDVVHVVESVSGRPARELLDGLYRTRGTPDIDRALTFFGLRRSATAGDAPWFGIQCAADACELAAVRAGSPADAAGLRAGDELIAIGDTRVQPDTWTVVWRGLARVDEPLGVLVAREGRVLTRTVTPRSCDFAALRLESVERPNAEQLARREAWLGARTI